MPPPSRQTHAFSPQGSHPRLTRGALAVPSQFVSGRGVRGLAAVCAVWSDDAASRRLTSLHSDAHAHGGGVTNNPPSGHVRTLSAPHPDGQTRTTPYRAVVVSGGADRKDDPYLLNGLNVHAGQLTYYAVSKALGSDVVPAACADGLKRKKAALSRCGLNVPFWMCAPPVIFPVCLGFRGLGPTLIS